MSVNLNDFLRELGEKTTKSIKNEPVKEFTPNPLSENRVNPKIHHEEPKIQYEEHKIQHEELDAMSNQEIDDDFIEKSIDYANVVFKSVLATFKKREERIKIFESIESLIKVYCNNNKKQENPVKLPPPVYPVREEIKPLHLNENNESIPDFKIIVDEEGKKHADLSNITDQDIESFKILSGIIPPPEKNEITLPLLEE